MLAVIVEPANDPHFLIVVADFRAFEAEIAHRTQFFPSLLFRISHNTQSPATSPPDTVLVSNNSISSDRLLHYTYHKTPPTLLQSNSRATMNTGHYPSFIQISCFNSDRKPVDLRPNEPVEQLVRAYHLIDTLVKAQAPFYHGGHTLNPIFINGYVHIPAASYIFDCKYRSIRPAIIH